jgi:hypothetical protein
MILRLSPQTAALVGETPAEWELLETQVRAGRWTSGPRADAARLRALAAELGVPVREASGPTETQQRRIREKLADGTLPRELLGGVSPVPPAGELPLMTGRPRVAPCEACDEVGMTRPIGGLLWHDACFIFWQAATAREA